MKKLIAILLLSVSLASFGQVDKGMMAIGGNVDVSLSFQSTTSNFNMAINPTLAVFAVRGLAIGGRYSFGVTSRRAFNVQQNEYRTTTTFVTGIGPTVKYYIGKKQLKGFVAANGSYMVSTQLTKGNVGNKNGFSAGGAVGMAYFFNPHIGLETGFYVQASGYEGDFPITRGGISVGIFTFLDKKKKE
ncbi:MAG TPA: hypothetical protein VK174_13295 [Chitinophagales bacterium]|nr:hypothetical protein [Chitinophagales bacterium]